MVCTMESKSLTSGNAAYTLETSSSPYGTSAFGERRTCWERYTKPVDKAINDERGIGIMIYASINSCW